ncbi:DNA polymerase III subunit chi [Sneathiella aquimaris]|uniref:DNA polymerase III subunit chi n=1 Tax=Sneathiella aquimaris TaxID=2599305 RepID=UPI00146EFA5F|nr:DNA polymerase III subunit chi [Sneathiella aquimaris]
MTEVSFYHLQAEPLERALPRLLEKVSERGMRALVRFKTEDLQDQLNTALWTYSARSFLPHGTAQDGPADQQPILLALEEEENLNRSDVLVLLENSDATDLNDFERCLYMFDSNDDAALDAARDRWKQFKSDGVSVTYWQQTETGWQKKA